MRSPCVLRGVTSAQGEVLLQEVAGENAVIMLGAEGCAKRNVCEHLTSVRSAKDCSCWNICKCWKVWKGCLCSFLDVLSKMSVCKMMYLSRTIFTNTGLKKLFSIYLKKYCTVFFLSLDSMSKFYFIVFTFLSTSLTVYPTITCKYLTQSG